MEGFKYKNNDKGVPVPQIPVENVELDDDAGIVVWAVKNLFKTVDSQNKKGKKQYTVYCSYLQVYKEKIYDLLNKGNLKTILQEGSTGLKLQWTK